MTEDRKQVQAQITVTLFEDGGLQCSLPNNMVIALGMIHFLQKTAESKMNIGGKSGLVEVPNFNFPGGIPRG